MAFVQGWSLPVDSLKIKPNTTNSRIDVNGLKLVDGEGGLHRGNSNVGFIVSDLIKPGSGVETCAGDWSGLQSSKRIYVINNKCKVISLLSFGTLTLYNSEEINIWVCSELISKSITLELEGTETNKKMFSISRKTLSYSETDVCSGGAKVTVTYAPSAAGNHSVNLVIKENGGNNTSYVTRIALKGNAVRPPASVSVTPAQLHFSEADTKTFKVTGYNLTGLLGLGIKIRGTGAKYFSVNKTYISKYNAMNGAYVAVTCNPTSKLNCTTAYVDIYHNNKLLKSVTLSYTKSQMAQGPLVQPDDEQEDEVKTGEFEVTNLAFGATTTDVDELSMSSKIYADGQNIVIESPEEQNALISDLAGRARNVSLQVGRNEIPVNASGIYIVRIREKTTKLIIK